MHFTIGQRFPNRGIMTPQPGRIGHYPLKEHGTQQSQRFSEPAAGAEKEVSHLSGVSMALQKVSGGLWPPCSSEQLSAVIETHFWFSS